MTKRIIPTALLLLTPLFFLPITLNFYTINKLILIILATLILLGLTIYQQLRTKKHLHQHSLFTLSLAIFWLVMGLNILVTKEAKLESLVIKGTLFLSLPVLAYLISTAKKNAQNLRLALTGLIIAGTTLALHGILQLVIFSEIASLPLWLRSISFTPAGAPLILLTTVVFSTIATLTWAIQEKEVTKKTTLFTAAGIQLAALVAYTFMITKGEINIYLLPLKAGWSLTLDALKNVRGLLFGVGMANFPVLFTQAKPTFLTQTDLWTTIFQTSSNEIFQLTSTTGITGVAAFFLIIFTTIRNTLKLEKSSLNLAAKLVLYAVILSFFIIPANTTTYAFFFILSALVATQVSEETLKEIRLPGLSSIISAATLSAVIIITGVFTYRVFAAENHMHQAQTAFAQNNAEQVYLNHIKAVQLMPQMTDYRISLSQINMTLASSLSQAQSVPNPETGQIAQLTEQQREQISVLIQRSVEQAQIAAELRPNHYASFQNLGSIYRNLINVADGAENFAIQYLGQAISKDPANPILRIDYGGLFYQLSQLVEDEETKINLLDQSIQQFQTAVRLRPNHANAYYNLSHSFSSKGSYRLAYQAMTQSLANIEDQQSIDYQKAQAELLELEKLLPQAPQPESEPAIIEEEANRETQSQLQQPAPLPSPLPGGPVELPDAELIQSPAPEVTPSPEEATPSPSPAEASPSPELNN